MDLPDKTLNAAGEEKSELVLPSRIESIERAAEAAAKAAADSGVDETAMFGIDLAVREAVANAVKHGNKLDETKRVAVSFHKTSESFDITIEDEGDGFDFNHLPDPTDPANLLKDSGRGTFLMRSFMDAVEWDSGGRKVKMTKRL